MSGAEPLRAAPQPTADTSKPSRRIRLAELDRALAAEHREFRARCDALAIGPGGEPPLALALAHRSRVALLEAKIFHLEGPWVRAIRAAKSAARRSVYGAKIGVLSALDTLSLRYPRLATLLIGLSKRTWWVLTGQKGRRIALWQTEGADAPTLPASADQRLATRRAEIPSAETFETEAHAADRPLVSIVIPCFNYGAFVGEAVQSALAQTFKDLEVIVVEGGSTDGKTPEIVARLAGPRVRVLARETPHRVGDNRNFGIEAARGKYVCCLDADDRVHPTYIEKALFLLEHYGYDVVSASLEMFGQSHERYTVAPTVTLQSLLQRNDVMTCAVFTRSLWQEAGGYRDHDGAGGHVHEDWTFWVRLAALGARFANMADDYLLHYRVHSAESLSRGGDVLPPDEQLRHVQAANADVVNAGTLRLSKRVNAEARRARDPLLNFRRTPTEPQARRLLLATPYMVMGGAERLTSRICQHLASLGWDITIVTTMQPDPAAGDSTAWFEGATARIFHLPRFLPEHQWQDFVEFVLTTQQINVMWISGSQYAYQLLPSLKRKFPGLVVLDQIFNTFAHTAHSRAFAGHLDKTLVENQEVQAWLMEKGAPAGRVALIPNGVDVARFSPLAKSAAFLGAFGIGDDDFVAGYSGRWSSEKNPLGFVRIASSLAGTGSIHFMMAGTGPLKADIQRALGRRPELDGRFHLLGNVDDIVEVLRSLDVLVLPSLIDGRPNAVLEALACGVPVIASRVGALPEIITDGENGFLCDPGDVAAFARAIAACAADRGLLARLKANARAYAEAHLDERDMLARYQAEFAAALSPQ